MSSVSSLQPANRLHQKRALQARNSPHHLIDLARSHSAAFCPFLPARNLSGIITQTDAAPVSGRFEMSFASLNDAYVEFAAAATELRRKYCNSFASRLDGALADDASAVWAEVPQKIVLLRRQFSDDFINMSAPAIIEKLNPGAMQDVMRQLKSFQNQGRQPQSFIRLLDPGERWHPSSLRAMLGAAIGAALALLLLALQTTDPDYGISTVKQTVVKQQAAAPVAAPTAGPPEGSTGAPPEKTNGPAPPTAAPAPTVVQPAPAAPTVGLDAIEQGALRIIIAALGAALGAFVVVCPPLSSLVRHFGLGRNIVGLIGKLGLAFMVRRVLFAVALGAVLLTAIGLLGAVFIGPKPIWSALFVLAAILGIVLARYSIPSYAASRRSAICEAAISHLNDQLGVDANTWCALSAALVVRTAATPPPDPTLDQIRSIIGARRDRNEPAENILRIIEQELNLDSGGTAATMVKSEFTWRPKSAEQYDAVGIVEVGDLVAVMVAPQLGTDARGVSLVFQKGKVRRKR